MIKFPSFNALILITLAVGCTSTHLHGLQQYSAVPPDCTVVDTFRIFSSSRLDAVLDLRERSFKALTTSVVDEHLVDVDVPASGFVVSYEEYLRHDSVIKARRQYEQEHPNEIVDWVATGYRVPDGAESFVGVFVACPDVSVR